MLVRTWATPANGVGLNEESGQALGAGNAVPSGFGLVAEGFQLLGIGAGSGGVTFERQWTIGNMGDDYGRHKVNGYGALVEDTWFNFIDTADILIVDDSATAVVLQSNVDSMWGLATNVTLNVEGFGLVVLTWNGATSYVNVGDTAFVAYIVSQLGNTIGLDILPKNGASPTAKNMLTMGLDKVVTMAGDNLIHMGN